MTGRGLDRWEHARLFALLNLGQADAFIANQTWKYTYNFWRPVTAIRWADDGNADTESDPAWRPFLQTPAYPDYPCALPTSAGAAHREPASVLRYRRRAVHPHFQRGSGAVAGADDRAAGQDHYPNV